MATITKRGKSWVLNWSDATGQHRKSLGKISELEAKTFLHAKEVELKTGNNPLHVERPLTMRDLSEQDIRWYQVHHPASFSRQTRYKELLMPHFGDIPINEINLTHILDYQRARVADKRTPKPQTINKEIGHLHAIFDRAITQFKTIKANPLIGLEWKMEVLDADMPRFFTKEELDAIYDADEEFAPIYQFFANTGVRLKEALQLTLHDLRDDQARIRSSLGRTNKTRQYRVVPLSDNAKDAIPLICKLSGAKKDSDLLMPQMNSRSWPRRATKAFHAAKVSQDPPTDGLKTFRHTFCSHLAMNDVPLRTIQKLAGHTSYRTTEIYANLMPSYLKDSVEKLNI